MKRLIIEINEPINQTEQRASWELCWRFSDKVRPLHVLRVLQPENLKPLTTEESEKNHYNCSLWKQLLLPHIPMFAKW